MGDIDKVIEKTGKKLKRISDEFRKSRKKLVEEVQDELAKATADFFLECPYVEKISWRQYTDYFNDGEPCTFSRHEIDFDRDVEYVDDSVLTTKMVKYSWSDREHEEVVHPEPVEMFVEALNAIPEEVCYDLFGDHVRVEITAKGVEVVEYTDHD